MEFWKKERLWQSVCAALGVVVILAACLIYSFKTYRDQIIEEQKEQLLTIAKAVSNSISIYTRFYFDDLQDLKRYEAYERAEEIYLTQDVATPLQRFLRERMELRHNDISDLMVTKAPENDADDPLDVVARARVNRAYVSVHHFMGTDSGGRIDILHDKDGLYYLGLSIPVMEDACRLWMIINIEEMYQKVGSYIRVGDNGYVMIKDSTGRILMHPVQEQIGIDVIEGREEMYPDFDYTELIELIDHQLEGREDVEIYHSYWWADEVPRRVRKIGAYTPVRFQDDFLIVCAVIDYDEIARPFGQAMVTIFLLSIVIVSFLAVILVRFWRLMKTRSLVEQENKRLREMNAKQEELRRQEEQLYHDQRLQLMGSLTGGIAHEFNNLLTPIMGYSGMIMMEADPQSDTYESAEEIYNAADRAKEIIRQIASFSRKHAGTPLKPLNIRKGVEGVLKMMETVIPPNVHLIVQGDWEEDSCILCGETELNQIMLNLCTNAFHAMKGKKGVLVIGGGILTGKQAESNFKASVHADSYMSLFVKDNGCGIPEDRIQRIFEPFFTTKPVGEGTGLGLSTVQNLVESLNGGIRVDSSLENGTCFTIYIPLCSGTVETSRKKTKKKSSLPKNAKRILLVEDEKKILKMFERALKGAGYEVTAVSNSLEAKKLLQEKRFDVVVTDYAMPGMNGGQLAALIQKMGLACRVIMITGLVEDQVLEYYRSHLIDMLLVKPLEVQTLIDAIEREEHSS